MKGHRKGCCYMANKYIVTMLSVGVLIAAVFLAAESEAQFSGGLMEFTISGSTGLEGVTMSGFPDTVVTDADGRYSVTVQYGWKGTVKPLKQGYTFDPASKTYDKITADETQDYTATLLTYKVSGSVGLPGVTMTGLPDDPVSDAQGKYSATVPYGWSGAIEPNKVGYRFEPEVITVQNVVTDVKEQDFKGSKILFTVAGNAGMDGVTIKGLPAPTVSKSDGSFSAAVEWGWSGTVVPEKKGYTFTPEQQKYDNVTSHQTDCNFNAQILQYTISGNTGVGGVVLQGLPNSPISDDAGDYSATVDWGFSATVTPLKDGYTFLPATKTYSATTSDKLNEDYKASIIKLEISGSTGVPGVTMSGFPTQVVTDEKGNYTVTVDYAWQGIVIPEKTGYEFTPTSKSFNPVTQDMPGQDFPGKLQTFAITGSVGLEGVSLTGFDKPVTSGPDGTYTAYVPYGWSGTVKPVMPGYDFEPASNEYQNVTIAQDNQNYSASLQKRQISGTIISGQGPVEGVTVTSGLGGMATETDSSGKYELTVDYGWSGVLTPTKSGYIFQPSQKQYASVRTDQINEAYKATLLTYEVAGEVVIGGTPVANIKMTAEPGNYTSMTNAKGEWSLTVPHGWTGKVTPTKEGWKFDPQFVQYANVTQNYFNGEPKIEAPTYNQEPDRPLAVDNTPPDEPLVSNTSNVPPVQPGTGMSNMDTNVPDGTNVGPGAGGMPEDTSLEQMMIRRRLDYFQQQLNELLAAANGGGAGTGPETATDPKAELRNRIADLSKQLAELEAMGSGGTPTGIDFNAGNDGMGTGPGAGGGRDTSDTTSGGYEDPEYPEHSTLVSGSWLDADLKTVLKEVATKADTDVYWDDTVKNTKISISFRNIPVHEAIKRILAKADATYKAKEIPNSYLVFKPISNLWDLTPINDVLRDISATVGVPIVADEQVVGDVTAEVDGVSLDTALKIILAGTNYVVQKTPDYYLVTTADVKSPYLFADVSETRRVKLSYVQAENAVNMLSTAYAQYAKADTETGSVLITAPAALAERIEADLKAADERPRHVMLDARIVVMEHGDLLNLGIEWSWPTTSMGFFGSDHQGQGTATADFDSKWPWAIQMGYTPTSTFTNALELALNMLAENSDVTILSTPQVLAQDGEQAEIKVVNEQYFFLTAQQQVNFFVNSQLEQVESGTTLTITPYIADNGEITLDISVEVSNTVAEARETGLPVIARRTATNRVRVQDGGTAAIAGLTESRSTLSYRKTPGFSGIPLIGKLFDRTKEELASQEIAIFITARLVPDTPGGSTPMPEPVRTKREGQMSDKEFRDNLKQSLISLDQQ